MNILHLKNHSFKEIFAGVYDFSNLKESRIALVATSNVDFINKVFSGFIFKKEVFVLSPYFSSEKLKKLEKEFKFKLVQDDSVLKRVSEYDDCLKLEECLLNVFTSGSESNEKAVQHSLLNLYFSAKGFSDFYGLDSYNWNYSLPFFHIGGLMTFFRSFFFGNFFDFKAEKGNCLSLLPGQLLDYPIKKLKSCELILLGGEVVSKEIQDFIIKNDLPVSRSYGMTETAAAIIGTSLEDGVSSNGIAFSGVELQLNRDGQLLVKGNQLFNGYYRVEKDSLDFSPQEKSAFFNTLDYFTMDSTGYEFQGRSSEIIKLKGENINLSKIKSVFLKLSEIKDIHLLAIDHLVYAFILSDLPKYPIEQTEIREYYKNIFVSELTSLEIPNRFYFFSSLNNFKRGLKVSKARLNEFVKKLNSQTALVTNSINKPDRSESSALASALMIHGLFGDPSEFFNCLPESLEADGLVIPGHGTSEALDLDSTVIKLNELILSKGYKLLYGYSLGGRLLLEWMKRFSVPDNINVILESAGPGGNAFGTNGVEKAREERLKQDQKLSEKLKALSSRDEKINFFRAWYRMDMFSGYRPSEDELKRKLSHDFSKLSEVVVNYSPGNQGFIFDEGLSLNPNSHYYFLYGEQDSKYKVFSKKFNDLGFKCIQFENVSHNIHGMAAKEIQSLIKKLVT